MLWQDTDGVVGHLPGTMGDTAGDGGKGIYHQLTKQEMDERAISAPPVLEFTAKVKETQMKALIQLPASTSTPCAYTNIRAEHSI